MRVTGRRSFVLSAPGEGGRGSLRPGGRGQPGLRPSPCPGFPRRGGSRPAPLFPPLWRGRDVGAAALPAGAQVGLGREQPGRPGRLTGGAARGGGGAWEGRPGIGPRRRLPGRLLRLASAEAAVGGFLPTVPGSSLAGGTVSAEGTGARDPPEGRRRRHRLSRALLFGRHAPRGPGRVYFPPWEPQRSWRWEGTLFAQSWALARPFLSRKSAVCPGGCNLTHLWASRDGVQGRHCPPPPKDFSPRSKDGQSCLPFKIESPVDLNLTSLPLFLSRFSWRLVMFRQFYVYIVCVCVLVSDSGLGTEAVLKLKLNE